MSSYRPGGQPPPPDYDGPPGYRPRGDPYQEYKAPGYDSYSSLGPPPTLRDNMPPPMPSGGGDSYRPGADRAFHSGPQNDYYDRRDRYDRRGGPYSSLRDGPPPSPRGPGDFRGGEFGLPQGDFTFRVDKPTGIQESRSDSYRYPLAAPPGSRGDRNRGDRNRGDRNIRRKDERPRRGGAAWRGARKYIAAERPILQMQHTEGGVELTFGEGDSGVTYKPFEDLSDDQETDMDISGPSGDESDAPKAKRARVVEPQSATESSTPRWSNPDPYTALPPPDESQRKKKDVVQLIRKARVQPTDPAAAAKDATVTAAPAAEFISCLSDSGDDDDLQIIGAVENSGNSLKTSNLGPFSAAPAGQKNQDEGEPWRATTRSTKAAHDANLPTVRTDLNPPPQRIFPGKSNELGSRKRTADDQIKFPTHSKLKKVNKMPVNGNINWEWRVKDGKNPTPWLIDHSGERDPAMWLHKEITDLYEHIRPRDFEEDMRARLVDNLRKKVRERFRDASIYAFGSFPSGLYLPTGDMDLVFMSDQYRNGGAAKYAAKSALYKFKAFLLQHRLALDNEIDLIIGAKVPLVKYVDNTTGLKVDISFENDTGVTAIETFKQWRREYPCMPILVTLVKHFLAMRGLNEPVNGGIGGFTVICLVVSMLQMMPEVQSRNMQPEHHLGDCLMKFLDLYGNRFNFETVAIRMSPPGYVSKTKVRTFVYKNPDRLSIIDPNNAANDISGGSANCRLIFNYFSEAHNLLRDRMNFLAREASADEKKNASILQEVFAGDYSTFHEQRRFLQHVYPKGDAAFRVKAAPAKPKW